MPPTTQRADNQVAPPPASHSMTATDRVMLYSVICYAVLALVPHIGGLPPVISTVVATLIFAVVTLALVLAAAEVPMAPWEEGAAAVALVLTWWFAVSPIAGQGPVERAIVGPAASVLFMLACVALGKFLSRLVREPNLLLPVAIVAALADVYTVFWGPTGKVLERAPQLVSKLSIAIPQMGSATGPSGVRGLAFIAAMGLGDVIFAALFFAAAFHFRLNIRRTFWYVLAAIVVGMMVVLFYPPVSKLPLLPFISAGFLLANYRAFKFSAEEKRNLLIAGAFVMVLVVAFVLVGRMTG